MERGLVKFQRICDEKKEKPEVAMDSNEFNPRAVAAIYLAASCEWKPWTGTEAADQDEHGWAFRNPLQPDLSDVPVGSGANIAIS